LQDEFTTLLWDGTVSRAPASVSDKTDTLQLQAGFRGQEGELKTPDLRRLTV
jgi:hypothetical protein